MIITLPIKYNQLLEPKLSLKLSDINNFQPFFQDSFVSFVINNDQIILLDDLKLVETNIIDNILFILHNEENLIKSNYKVKITIFCLKNNFWLIRIEKIHFWDYFQSISIINIQSKNKDDLMDFFNKYFYEKYSSIKKYENLY
jgi:hypothetical protein